MNSKENFDLKEKNIILNDINIININLSSYILLKLF